MTETDVLIVGAGPGGLAAGMLLRAAGLKVRILERQSQVGGRNGVIREQGFRFDVGPTFFLYTPVIESIFAATGRDLHDYVKLIKLDPQYRLVFGAGGEIVASPEMAKLKQAIAQLSPGDAQRLDYFMADNRKKFAAFKPCLESAFGSLRDVMKWRILKLLPVLRPWNSLEKELSRYFDDPRVRLAFAFQSKYLGMSPSSCPGMFSILSFLEYEFGVYHPVGGCNAVPLAMTRVLEEMGTSVELNHPVEEILFEGKRAVGVRTRQGEIRARAVVVNADFADAMRRLIPDEKRRRWKDHRIEKKSFSCSTFMMYLGMNRRYDEQPHHNIYLPKNYWETLTDIETRHVLSADPAVYVQNAVQTDPTLAPAGKSTLYILAPVTHQHENVNWAEERAEFRQAVVKQLPKLGFNEVEKHIEFERVITPDDWAQQHIYRGATFNLAHSFRQMLHLRPHNRFEDVKGMYLVGGGTHPGSGLPVIFESAKITAKLLMSDLGKSARREQMRPAMELPELTAR